MLNNASPCESPDFHPLPCVLANRMVAQNLVERGAGEGRRMDFRLTANGKRILTAG